MYRSAFACLRADAGLVHLSGLYIMDEFDAASRAGQAGLVSKRLERCYLYGELERLQEQQEKEEEKEEEQGPLGGTATPPHWGPSTTQVHIYFKRIRTTAKKLNLGLVLKLIIYSFMCLLEFYHFLSFDCGINRAFVCFLYPVNCQKWLGTVAVAIREPGLEKHVFMISS